MYLLIFPVVLCDLKEFGIDVTISCRIFIQIILVIFFCSGEIFQRKYFRQYRLIILFRELG